MRFYKDRNYISFKHTHDTGDTPCIIITCQGNKSTGFIKLAWQFINGLPLYSLPPTELCLPDHCQRKANIQQVLQIAANIIEEKSFIRNRKNANCHNTKIYIVFSDFILKFFLTVLSLNGLEQKYYKLGSLPISIIIIIINLLRLRSSRTKDKKHTYRP